MKMNDRIKRNMTADRKLTAISHSLTGTRD